LSCIPIPPVFFNKIFDKTNVPTVNIRTSYDTVNIRTSYDPVVPNGSPIDRSPTQSGDKNCLGDAEVSMYGRTAVSLTTSITLGDSLLATACNIKSPDQLRVAIRYLIRYVKVDDPGRVIVEEALEVMKKDRMDYINSRGGAEAIIEKALDHHFGEHQTFTSSDNVKHKYSMPKREWYPVNNAHEDMEELEKIKHLDTLLDLVKKYDHYNTQGA